MKLKKTLAWSLLLISAFGLAGCNKVQEAKNNYHNHSHVHVEKVVHHTKHAMNVINYKKPSENKPYPKEINPKTDKIVVSIPKQRTYIKRNGKTIYTMYCSTGSHNRTPTGHYKIDGITTNWFYSAKEHEGAQYATGWHDGGVYLFHATPANKNKKIMKNVAKDLGKKPSSHGCVHLTIPDAKYMESHAKVGTPVIIEK